MATQPVASVGSVGDGPGAETLLVGGGSERVVESLATRLAQRFEPLSVSAASDMAVTLDAVGAGTVDTAVLAVEDARVLADDAVMELLADDGVVVALVAPPGSTADTPDTVTIIERHGDWLPRLESWLRIQFDSLDAAETESVEPRKQYERMLERQNDRLKEFTGVISHDLRNPLGVIVDRAELARETGDEDHLDAIVETAREMEAFLDDLLELARQGSVVGDPSPVELDTAARRAWRRIETDGATLVIDDPPTVVADEGRLCQLLENLFANAVEHGSTSPPSQAQGDAVEHGSTSPDSQAREEAAATAQSVAGVLDEPTGAPSTGGTGNGTTPGEGATGTAPDGQAAGPTVTVGSVPGGFYVADDGPGIPAEERDEVFEHGYTTSDDGTGFGLSIVESVAGAHGWEVELAPPEAAEGARFEITGVERPGGDPAA